MTPHDDDGEVWDGLGVPCIPPTATVEVVSVGSSSWTTPLTASAVRWSDVRRWRYAQAQPATTPTPLTAQVGGGHYKGMAIQPVEYINANGLDYLQGNVIKYVSRHKSKNGAEDIRKAIHYLELILELQYK